MIRCGGKVYGLKGRPYSTVSDCIVGVFDPRADKLVPMQVSIAGIEHTALLTRENVHSLISQLECALIKGE